MKKPEKGDTVTVVDENKGKEIHSYIGKTGTVERTVDSASAPGTTIASVKFDNGRKQAFSQDQLFNWSC